MNDVITRPTSGVSALKPHIISDTPMVNGPIQKSSFAEA
jgi:hypothetical protein